MTDTVSSCAARRASRAVCSDTRSGRSIDRRCSAAAASVVRRVTQPSNRTAALAIVLTARGHGIPARAEHLDMLDRAIRRDDPDLGPLLQGVVGTLARVYGREAVRLILD